jgi:prepilin-type N-terminal cleavage/methylation domain-containing protein
MVKTAIKQKAFTLVELLVVIALIVALASFVLAVTRSVQQAALQQRTQVALSLLMSALQQARTDGHVIPIMEHPLAGTAIVAGARPLYRGDRGAGWIDLDSSAEALQPTTLAAIAPAFHPTCVMPDDRFSERDYPMFFGVSRKHMTLLGASVPMVTTYRVLPDPGREDNGVQRILPQPYTAAKYPDAQYLVKPRMYRRENAGVNQVDLDPATTAIWEERMSAALDRALGSELARLRSLGVVRAQEKKIVGPPGSSGADEPLNMSAYPLQARMQRDPVVAPEPDYSPGRFRVEGQWSPLWVRGLSTYDAWGFPILVSLGSGGAITVQSPGRDGCFMRDPGDDGVFTSSADGVLLGDDQDAQKDNMMLVSQ